MLRLLELLFEISFIVLFLLQLIHLTRHKVNDNANNIKIIKLKNVEIFIKNL